MQEHFFNKISKSSPGKIQLNLKSSSTDDSFTMANSNLFLSPDEILQNSEEKKISREIFFFHYEFVC